MEGEESDVAYWLAVSRVPHIGPVRIERLIQRFATLRMAWYAPEDQVRAVLEPRPLAAFLTARINGDPVRELRDLQHRGISVSSPGNGAYPPLLKEISGRPTVLYIRGAIEAADGNAVAIVGTRRSSAYGRDVAARIASELAKAGITVVSGLARGIDAAAHRAALESGGRTIAVLGSGVDVIYPAEHARLAAEICESGAVISEQEPGAKPDAQNFPARNRIVSGMTLGVVVIEAPARSGALITAGFAADQGRDVFVVPGPVNAPNSEGSNALLRDGARLVRNGEDVLEDLGLGLQPTVSATQRSLALDESELRVMACLVEEARHIDEIAEETGLIVSGASALLLTMELKGLVRNVGAQFYARR